MTPTGSRLMNDVYPSRYSPGRLAFENAGGAGEEADLVHPGRDLLLHGEPERLAGVLRLGTHQLLGPLLYGVGDPEHGQLPLRGRRVAPRLEGPLRRLDTPGRRPPRSESGAWAKVWPVAGFTRS